jgi:hypothetical protein
MQLETEIAAWALDEACLVTGRKFENMFNEGRNPFALTPALSQNGREGYASAPKRMIKKVKEMPWRSN